MAPRSRPAGRDVCRAPILPAALDEVELDQLEDHDGWADAEVRGSAVAADAEHVSFAGCRIIGVRFTGARLFKLELTDVELVGCDLSGVVLEQVVLERVALRDCRLSGADLGGGTMRDVSFSECQLDELGLRMARTERFEVSGGNAPGLDAYQAWLTASTWRDVDLTGANLTEAHLGRARFLGTTTLRDIVGARALSGAAIDERLALDVGRALLADLRIEIADDPL